MQKINNIHYTILSRWHDPEVVFDTLFAKEKYNFWLDSSLINKTNRFSYMGSSPVEIYSYFLKNSRIVVEKKNNTTYSSEDIFTYLNTKLQQQVIIKANLPFDFIGGFVGYFGYELKAYTDGKAVHTSPYPDSLWFLVHKFIAFDHLEKKVYLVCWAENKKDAKKWFGEVISKLKIKNKPYSSFIPIGNYEKPLNYTFARSKEQYLQDIKTCKNLLKKGESYQICLTNTITTKANISPVKLYKMLRINNPAPYSACITYDNLTILGSSPEQFLKIDSYRNVQTKPIKGTIRRGKTLAEDKKLKQQLLKSKKEWSENAMIVDLLRNDLGKICEFGSVRVKKSMAIESYKSVHQLVSTVVGELRPDVSLIDCIKACFPGGSMTGAPKIRTMELLDIFEKQARGIYSGALGFLSFNQTAQLSIIIRTIIAYNNELSIGSGGAILIDSLPQAEYDEMLLKTKALVETIEKAMYTTPMHTIFLALGSNVGNKKENIKRAIAALEKEVKKIQVAKLYETKPMYYEKQEMFVNTVIKGQTELSPQELLAFVKSLEKELGRQKRFRNGPREIDIDILFYDQLIQNDTDLIIPHSRISERAFVLEPFLDIDPAFIHPILKRSMKDLFAQLKNHEYTSL